MTIESEPGLYRLPRRRLGTREKLCGNDLMAVGALRAVEDVGLAVPQEVSVVGFDDIHLASYPGLTSVHQPIQTLGRRAAELLIGRAMTSDREPNGGEGGGEVLDVHVAAPGGVRSLT